MTTLYTQNFSGAPAGGVLLTGFPTAAPHFVSVFQTGPGFCFVNDSTVGAPLGEAAVLSDFTSTHFCRITHASMPTGNQEISGPIFSSSNDTSSILLVRMATDNTRNYYYARITRSLANEVRLFRCDAGTDVELISVDRGLSSASNLNNLRLKATGTNPVVLELQVDATNIVTFSDSTANRKQTGTPGIGFDGKGDTNYITNITVTDGATVGTYPQSTTITGATFNAASVTAQAYGSDIWVNSWGAGGDIWTVWGDGVGFGAVDDNEQFGAARAELGLSKIFGTPPTHTGTNIFGGKNATVPATFGGKPGGIMSADSKLYMWNSQNLTFDKYRIGESSDGGLSWTFNTGGNGYDYGVGTSLTQMGGAIGPGFVQYGQHYAGGDATYFYIHFPMPPIGGIAVHNSLRMGRIPRATPRTIASHQFITALDANFVPTWGALASAIDIFTNTGKVGWGNEMFYNAPLNRFILSTFEDEAGTLALYESVNPWGPWFLIQRFPNFQNTNAKFSLSFPRKWLSGDGKSFIAMYSGAGGVNSVTGHIEDSLQTITGTFTTAAPPPVTGNVLAQLVASMPNNTWAELLGTTGKAAFTDTSGNTADGFIGIFSTRAHWDPATRRMYFIGSDHNPVPTYDPTHFAVFDADTNNCFLEPNPPFISTHAYGHNVGKTGKLFATYDRLTTEIDPFIWDIPTKTWSSLPPLTSGSAGQIQTSGVEYFPTRTRLYYIGADAVWSLLDGASSWVLDATPNIGDFHGWAVYSPQHDVMCFGGGDGNPLSVFRMNAAGTITQLQNAPQTPYGIAQNANRPNVDPITGNILVFTAVGNLWSLQPLTDTWTIISTQPSSVSTAVNNNAFFSCSMSTYGCVLTASGQGPNPPRFWVYKAGTVVGDTQAPIVSDVQAVSGPGTTSETINFNTNEGATSFVRYGATTSYGQQTTATTAFTNAHSHVLTGLPTDGSIIHYQIAATDAAGNGTNEPDRLFVTQTVSQNPIVSNVTPVPGAQSFYVSWNTNVPCQTTLRWGLTPTSLTNSFNDATLKTFHTVTASPTTPNTDYYFQIVAIDSAGNQTVESPVLIHTTTVSSFTFPTLAQETAAYDRTLSGTGVVHPKSAWTKPAVGNFSGPDPTGFTLVPSDITIHDGTEGDDLWTLAHQVARYGANAGFLTARRNWWLNYFKNNFRSFLEVDQGRGSDHSFLYDHVYGWGLEAAHNYIADAPAITELRNLASLIDGYWINERGNGIAYPSSHWMSYFGGRGPARQLRLMISAAEATGDSLFISARDKLINLWMSTASNHWDPRGMYWYGDFDTDNNILGAGHYARGSRVASVFQTGLIAEVLAQAARVTGRADIKTRIVQMANFVLAHAVDPTFQYTGSFFGFFVDVDSQVYNFIDYSFWPSRSGSPVTFWDTNYTAALVNLLVYAYKYTGDLNYLGEAFYLYQRANGGPGVWTSGTFSATAGRTVSGGNAVHHYADTEFDTSNNNVYFRHNRGELQYTYMLFENGGAPTLDTVADTTPPTVVTVTTPSITATAVTINVTTNEPSDIEIHYGTTTAYGSSSGVQDVNPRVTSHSVAISSLPSNTDIHYKIFVTDQSGNLNNTEPDRIVHTAAAADTTAPVLSGHNLLVASTSVTITFTSNEGAQSKVLYGTVSPPTTSFPASYTGSFVLQHSITVSGLTPDTPYFIQPRAIDQALNEQISDPIISFRTLPISQTQSRRGTMVRRIKSNPVTYQAVVWLAVPQGFEKFYASSSKRSLLSDLTEGHPATITALELADLRAGKFEEVQIEVVGSDLSSLQLDLENKWAQQLQDITDTTEFDHSGRTWDAAGTWKANP